MGQASSARADQIADLKHTIAVNPDDLDAWVTLGQRLYSAGRVGETEWVMGQALALNRDEPMALWLEGLSRYRLGDFPGAKASLWHLYEIGGTEQVDWPREIDRRPTYEILGRLFLDEGDLFSANLFLSKACEDSTDNSDCLFLLGYVDLQRHRPEEAEDAFSKAHDRKPHDALILRYYARAKVVADQSDWFLAQKASSLDLYPGAPAEAATAKRTFEADEPLIRAAIKANPTDSFAYDLLGEYLAARGNFTDSIQALHRAIALDPTDVQARMALAKIILTVDPTDRRTEAEAQLVKAIATNPGYRDANKDGPHIDLLLELLKRQGRDSEASALEAWRSKNVPKEP
jgi:cytochrome c-type biogenesis protein CcmH/NrfG